MFEFERECEILARITVIGVGGAGGNAINRMIAQGLSGVEFLAINTDAQALKLSRATQRIQVGSKLTKGLGSGGIPDVGRQAVEEDEALIIDSLKGSDMVFVTAGMGGGTGTGGAPLVARIARELGALTVAIVSRPFNFEGKRRNNSANEGIKALKEAVDTLIVIPNEKLLQIVGTETPLVTAFSMADDVLLQATRGISDLITIPGLVNLDFADVKTIMANMGDALMGTGTAEGPDRASLATRQAISSPLLDDVDIHGARGVLVNITGGHGMTLHEVSEATSLVQEAVGDEANIIFGAVVDEGNDSEFRVTVIATGFGSERASATVSREFVQRVEPVKARPTAPWAERPAARVTRLPLPLAAAADGEAVRATSVALPQALRGGTGHAPAARLAPASLHQEPAVHADPRGMASAETPPMGVALQVEEAVTPQPASLGAPLAESVRAPELPHLLLPRTELRSWNADDLDVPAFLRQQMD